MKVGRFVLVAGNTSCSVKGECDFIYQSLGVVLPSPFHPVVHNDCFLSEMPGTQRCVPSDFSM